MSVITKTFVLCLLGIGLFGCGVVTTTGTAVTPVTTYPGTVYTTPVAPVVYTNPNVWRDPIFQDDPGLASTTINVTTGLRY